MTPELRAWLDRLLTVVDGLTDDVRYLAEHGADNVALSVDHVANELTAMQNELYRIPLELNRGARRE